MVRRYRLGRNKPRSVEHFSLRIVRQHVLPGWRMAWGARNEAPGLQTVSGYTLPERARQGLQEGPDAPAEHKPPASVASGEDSFDGPQSSGTEGHGWHKKAGRMVVPAATRSIPSADRSKRQGRQSTSHHATGRSLSERGDRFETVDGELAQALDVAACGAELCR